ncbi:MAG: hypothetical protein R3E60_02400 [Alphaproteobacteria bacterium]
MLGTTGIALLLSIPSYAATENPSFRSYLAERYEQIAQAAAQEPGYDQFSAYFLDKAEKIRQGAEIAPEQTGQLDLLAGIYVSEQRQRLLDLLNSNQIEQQPQILAEALVNFDCVVGGSGSISECANAFQTAMAALQSLPPSGAPEGFAILAPEIKDNRETGDSSGTEVSDAGTDDDGSSGDGGQGFFPDNPGDGTGGDEGHGDGVAAMTPAVTKGTVIMVVTMAMVVTMGIMIMVMGTMAVTKVAVMATTMIMVMGMHGVTKVAVMATTMIMVMGTMAVTKVAVSCGDDDDHGHGNNGGHQGGGHGDDDDHGQRGTMAVTKVAVMATTMIMVMGTMAVTKLWRSW